MRVRVVVANGCRLLIVTSWPRHACRSVNPVNFVSSDWVSCCRRTGSIRYLNSWRLSRSLLRLWTLSWWISSETEHVGKVLTKLSSSWQAARGSSWVGSLNVWNTTRASSGVLEHIVLWRVHALLLAIMHERWWMWRRACRHYTCVSDTSQMTILRTVHYKRTCLSSSGQSNAIGALTWWFLLLASAHETLVTVRSTSSTWCRSYTVGWVLRLCILLLSIAKNSLKQWSSILLALIVLRLEANRSIWSVKALVSPVGPGTIPSLILSSLHFHLS